MDWQMIVALAVVTIAAAFILVRVLRSWRGTKSACGGSCGCAKPAEAQPKLIAPDQLVIRKR
jgi:hypothetical protein